MKKTMLMAALFIAAGLVLTGCFKKENKVESVVDNGNQDVAATQPAQTTARFTVDAEKSGVDWQIKQANSAIESKGIIKIKEGTMEFDGDKLTGGRFVLDMTTIAEAGQNPKVNSKLETLLKGADFFDVANNPISELLIKSVSATSTSTGSGQVATSTGNMYNIVADLTIKGVAVSVEFPAEVIKNGDVATATAELKIKGGLWGIKGASSDESGSAAIADEIVYKISLVANGENPTVADTAATSTTPVVTSSGDVQVEVQIK